MTSSEIALIRLYYESYGLEVKEIASALSISPLLVSELVKEKALTPAIKSSDDSKRQLLLENDLDRQLLLAPLYAKTEVAILGKAYDVIMHIDPDDETASVKLANVAKAWSALKSAASSFKADDIAGQQGIAIQILNTL